MRKLTHLLLISLTVSSAGFAQGIEFRQGTWDEIKELARVENKLIFFDANTSWCGPCKWMVKNTFTDENVGKFYGDNFISYELDMEKGEGIELAEEFEITAYPTLLFLNNAGEIVHKTMGAIDAEKFLELGRIAADPRRNLAGMQQRYKRGDRSSQFIREYLVRLSDAGKPRKEILDWYFYQLNENDLLTKENFEVIKKHISQINSPQFKFLMQNKEAYSDLASEKDVNEKIYNVYRSSLFSALYSGDSLKWETAKLEVRTSSVQEREKLLAFADIYYFSRKKDWTSYVTAMNHYATTYEADNWQSFNSYAWQVYKNNNITDKASIKLALSWIDRSIKINNCYANNDTKAALLHKLGDQKGALKAANKAISLAGPAEDTSGTKGLIAQISN